MKVLERPQGTVDVTVGIAMDFRGTWAAIGWGDEDPAIDSRAYDRYFAEDCDLQTPYEVRYVRFQVPYGPWLVFDDPNKSLDDGYIVVDNQTAVRVAGDNGVSVQIFPEATP